MSRWGEAVWDGCYEQNRFWSADEKAWGNPQGTRSTLNEDDKDDDSDQADAANNIPQSEIVGGIISSSRSPSRTRDDRFRKKDRAFFKPGKIFASFKPRDLPNAQQVRIHYFVAWKQEHDFVYCLPILFHTASALPVSEAQNCRYARVYTGRKAPEVQLTGLGTPLLPPIRVEGRKRDSSLHSLAYIDFHSMYTIEYNVPVCEFGKLAEDQNRFRNAIVQYGFAPREEEDSGELNTAATSTSSSNDEDFEVDMIIRDKSDDEVYLRALLDTQAVPGNLISLTKVRSLGFESYCSQGVEIFDAAGGMQFASCGKIRLQFRIKGWPKYFHETFYVVKNQVADAILGQPFLKENKVLPRNRFFLSIDFPRIKTTPEDDAALRERLRAEKTQELHDHADGQWAGNDRYFSRTFQRHYSIGLNDQGNPVYIW
ncbi:hypothetical protein NA57DRAFT_77565 [Rhizodiscina lignyota]|uniref:DUF6590 domain-containing protein n=1 Tax=Rhizodiscina lignyota TaxID=1504668 RepID=A0A9P4IDF6_9PEZI|nr:hypothetical protein NA57DRAFT_77565 [Rhizodiscina lignyota]